MLGAQTRVRIPIFLVDHLLSVGLCCCDLCSMYYMKGKKEDLLFVYIKENNENMYGSIDNEKSSRSY